MKNYIITIMTCSLLVCCRHEQKEPIIPEEPEPEAPYEMPCSCGDEWPQEETNCDRDLPWNFPIGTDEWNKMTTHQEALDACQIPEEILASLSTEDLTEICLQYPFLVVSLTSCNSYDPCLNALFREFNGIRELFLREDAAKALLKKYRCLMQNRNLSFLEEPTMSDVEKGLFTLSTVYPEFLISRYQTPDDSKEDYIEILQQLVCGYEKKLMYPFFSYKVNFYARAVMLVKIDEQNLESIPQKGNNGVFERGWLDEPTVSAIDELSCQYITN